MCIEEPHDQQGLERFLKVAVKYYESKHGTPQKNLREKAMTQWLDLPSYKDKMKVLEFMLGKIKQIEDSQTKITKYFRPLKQQTFCEEILDNEITELYQEFKTAQKRQKSPFSKFYEETYWKLKLENEHLKGPEIKKIVLNQWEAKPKQ